MSTSEGRTLKMIYLPVQHKYSIQLVHACPTMHHIRLVPIYEKSQFNTLVWGSLTLAPVIMTAWCHFLHS